jgi:ABC-2 type transport system ATP-binding protein
LDRLVSRKVGTCSGGEQQRLRFALALLPDPQLLILDEPTAGMDAGARREFWETMHAETSEGRTVVFATHYLEEAQAYAPRTILIDHGRIRADRPNGPAAGHGRRPHPYGEPARGRRDDALNRLRGMPGVREVRLEGGRVRVEGSASDDVALLLLSELGARDLEVSVPSLESAFLALTQEGRDA